MKKTHALAVLAISGITTLAADSTAAVVTHEAHAQFLALYELTESIPSKIDPSCEATVTFFIRGVDLVTRNPPIAPAPDAATHGEIIVAEQDSCAGFTVLAFAALDDVDFVR